MALTQKEAIIIGCIVGIVVLITFGLILWFVFRKPPSPNRQQFSKVASVPQQQDNSEDSDDKHTKPAHTSETEPILPKTNNDNNENTDNIIEQQPQQKPQPENKQDAINPTTFGEMQSPINIISTTKSGKTKLMKDDEFISNPLRFRYPSQLTDCTILNNGHTVQINIASHNKCQVFINNKSYSLKQFHFHTPSEHLIDSQQFEMEMHLVHINQQNEIAVLGFIFTTKQKRIVPKLKFSESKAHLVLEKEVNKLDTVSEQKPVESSDDELKTDDEFSDNENHNESEDKKHENDYGNSKKGNDFLEQFWDELPMKKTEEDIALKNVLSFDFLFETSSNNFKKKVETNEIDIDMELFEYTGSLTTPPYTEGVQWLVSKTTHFINNAQLHKLSACWGHENNARPVQEYFGRTVSIRNKSSYNVGVDS